MNSSPSDRSLVQDPPHVQAVGSFSHPALADFPLSLLADGRVVGEFFNAKLASVYQPILQASDERVIGHQAYLRVAAGNGEALTPYAVFARAADDIAAVKLDRLTRTLHALNYFHHAPESAKLFVHVDQRLLGAIAEEHGAVFESILESLGIAPDRVVISLPHTALANGGTLVRSVLNYRRRGYWTMLTVNGLSDPGLGRVFLAEPRLIQFDLPSTEDADATAQLIRAMHRNGYMVMARRLEDEHQVALARELDFDLLHGFHFGRPAVAPSFITDVGAA